MDLSMNDIDDILDQLEKEETNLPSTPTTPSDDLKFSDENEKDLNGHSDEYLLQFPGSVVRETSDDKSLLESHPDLLGSIDIVPEVAVFDDLQSGEPATSVEFVRNVESPPLEKENDSGVDEASEEPGLTSLILLDENHPESSPSEHSTSDSSPSNVTLDIDEAKTDITNQVVGDELALPVESLGPSPMPLPADNRSSCVLEETSTKSAVVEDGSTETVQILSDNDADKQTIELSEPERLANECNHQEHPARTRAVVGFNSALWESADDVSDSELESFLNTITGSSPDVPGGSSFTHPVDADDYEGRSADPLSFTSADNEDIRLSPPLELAPPIPMTLVNVAELMDLEQTLLPPGVTEIPTHFSQTADSSSMEEPFDYNLHCEPLIPENEILVNVSDENGESHCETDISGPEEYSVISEGHLPENEILINVSDGTGESSGSGSMDFSTASEEHLPVLLNGAPVVPEQIVTNENAVTGHVRVIFSADNLGKIKPAWVPDEYAPICMLCGLRFTLVKRRHHCRACGSVICASCGNYRAKLEYLEMKEDRICALCNETFKFNNGCSDRELGDGAGDDSGVGTLSPSPVIVASLPTAVPPGVLRRQDRPRNSIEPKSVVFFDGIRPGGDLMEPEFHGNGRRLAIMNAKRQRRSPGAPPDAPPPPKSRGPPKRSSASHVVRLFVSRDVLPVMDLTTDGHYILHEHPDIPQLLAKFATCPSETVDFFVNACLRITVQLIDLKCCVNQVVWCYSTSGMRLVGQDEVVILLVKGDQDILPPRDVFIHLNEIFLYAKQGNVIGNLGHSMVGLSGYENGFLGSRNNAGFLYIRRTFQCLTSLKLPEPPYLFGILMTQWEVPWAKLFPLRLMLRLGAEYRYYPCPLVCYRNRKPVYEEIGHTVMNLLCDFRNYQYHLPCVDDTECCMEKGLITVRLPRYRYDQIVKVCQASNEHVLPVGLGFSKRADAHLVCIQNLENGQYETQAINIQTKGRQVTGTSFIIFNASLKNATAGECRASVVEDGIMVQITIRGLEDLKLAMKSMRNIKFKAVQAAPVAGLDQPPPPIAQDAVVIEWTNESKHCNTGVRSPIDGKDMTGVESRRVSLKHSVDFLNGTLCVRCTEVFLTDERDSNTVYREEIDLSRLAENLAMATCSVLRSHLYDYRDSGSTKLGLRVSLGPDIVQYDVGTKGEHFADSQALMEFDDKIMPLINECARVWGERPRLEMELIFRIFQH